MWLAVMSSIGSLTLFWKPETDFVQIYLAIDTRVDALSEKLVR